MKYLAVAALLCGSAYGQTVLYSTFNEQDQQNLFDCCKSIPVSKEKDTRQWVGIPFTPAADARIIEVDVALSNFGPPTAAPRIEIYGSTNGLPGDAKLKHHFDIAFVQPGGQCCQYQSGKAHGVLVQANGHYWIVIKGSSKTPSHNFVGGWNLNTLGLEGQYVTEGYQAEWQWTAGPLPAVRIITR